MYSLKLLFCFCSLLISNLLRSQDCSFSIDYEQQSCSEYDLFSIEQEQLDWYVNDEFQLTATEYDFEATNAGTYEICVVNEGCPSETNICETFVVTEDCFEDITLVNNNKISNLFNVYPNPAIGVVNIAGNLEIVNSIEIHDTTGNLVYQSFNPSSKRIFTGDISSGLYIMSFSTNEGVGLRKLLINK